MKDRLVTLGLAACALGLFWLLLFPKPQRQPVAPHPLTTGSDGEGYFAVARWLGTTGVPTVILHRRFDALGSPGISAQPTGNLLVMTMPFDVVLQPQEYAALGEWIEKGNTALILAALDDTPLWCATSDEFSPELRKIAALGLNDVQSPNKDPAAKIKAGLIEVMTPAGRAVALHPSGTFALLDGVRQLATQTPLPSVQWRVKAMDTDPVLDLARRADTADSVLWLKSSGHGAMIISAYSSLFNNAVIGKADNARLLSNIIAWSLRPGGRVIFDDAHQGVLDEYNAEKFFADPRLHQTLLWLVVLWLAWVVASQPLRAGPTHAGSLDEGAMLRVTARFLAGVLRPVASAQWLMDEFFDRVRRRHGLLHSDAPPWEWLGTHAGVASGLLSELRDLYAQTQAGERVNLVRLQTILSQISGQTS